MSALEWEGRMLRRHGAPHRILSGSLHYFRIHPDHWADRMARLAAMGLNTVDTYIPWNFHERRRGAVRFDGWRDVERFIALAADHGLDVIVRPSPYICAEWTNGGLPSWVTGIPRLAPRSSDPQFLELVQEWYDRLLPRLVPLQSDAGGPIVAVQLENEYGSYGDDSSYLVALREMLVRGGIRELIYTADGPTELMLDGGTIPGTPAAATFGSRAGQADRILRSRRDEPFICAEFWGGWFDHWGGRHHVRDAESAAADLGEILDLGGSFSLYMAHGGTNFGLWSGANHVDGRIRPTVTSYDSDAPIAEDGSLTPKFAALRELMVTQTGVEPPAPPASLPKLEPRTLPVTRGADMLDACRAVPVTGRGVVPPTFEELEHDGGLVLYSATPIMPAVETMLTIRGLRDRATVWIDGERIAVVDADAAARGIPLPPTGARVSLDILVESLGHLNYGPLLGERKGILEGVSIERRIVLGWDARRIPLDDEDTAAFLAASAAGAARASGFATSELVVDESADCFLALPGYAKGFVWVGDFLLGRYWEVGPQQTLYVPGALLRPGANTVTVLELERFGGSIEVRDRAELGPPEEYVETFDELVASD